MSADRDSYAALADEMNDADVPPWDEADWDAAAVAAGARYAKANGLRWPPGTGDYDRLYERERRGLFDLRRALGRAPTVQEWEEERR